MNMMSSVSRVADLPAPADALLVAFASGDGDMVDQHFGSASAFYLYEVSTDNAVLLARQAFGTEKKDCNEDKLKPRLAWLAGADIVYCGSVGGSATRQLVALGINPIQVKGGPDVEELIEGLQRQLNGSPEFWLANILKQKQKTSAAARFDAMDEEGWEE
ncbi:NifB/NifX family molybdenum-iron cluster-binding protein [Porticoccus sp.]